MINTEESRAGAMACLEAMKGAEKIMTSHGYEGTLRTCKQYLQDNSKATQLIIKAADTNLSPFMMGFVATLAEYVCFTSEADIELDMWLPWAAMTKAQAKSYKKKWYTDD